MSNTEKSIQAVRSQVASIAADRWPHLTTKQRDALAEKLIATIGPNTLEMSVALSANEDMNLPTLLAITAQEPALVRVAPNVADVLKFKIAELEKSGLTVRAEERLNLSRSIAGLSEDDRLEAVPADFVAREKQQTTESRPPKKDETTMTDRPGHMMSTAELDAAVEKIFGKKVSEMSTLDRLRYHSAIKFRRSGDIANETLANELAATEKPLSPTERLTAFRLAQQKRA